MVLTDSPSDQIGELVALCRGKVTQAQADDYYANFTEDSK